MRLIDATTVERKVEQFLHWRYEDYGTMFGPGLEILNIIRNAPTILPPPNAPLTLDELREMDGEPVWVKCLYDESRSGWTLVDADGDTYNDKFSFYGDCYNEAWLAYHRKPEEGTK